MKKLLTLAILSLTFQNIASAEINRLQNQTERDYEIEISLDKGHIQTNFPAASNDDALVIYSDSYFRGESLVIHDDLPYVGDFMNDKLSSFKIPPGWEVRFYEHHYYQGKFYTRRADSPDSKFARAFNDTISSVRILKKGYTSEPTDPTDEVIIYSEPNFKGARLRITDDLPYVGDRMNDKLSSFKIPPGWKVRFYEHHNYQGKYYTLTSENFDGKFARGFDNIISSVRILQKGYVSESTDPADEVIIYSEPNFKGARLSITDDLPYVGDRMNDKLSSFKIPPGWKVRFYEHHNYQGKYYTLTSENFDGKFARGFNDTISSVRILKKG